MTTSEPSPLDRVEMALAAIAESNAASAARLDRIEQSNQDSVARLDRIEQLTESNARAIQAHGEELRTSLAAHRADFQASIADVVDMVAENARSSAENSAQVQVLIGESRENSKQHQSFLERFDRVLGEIRALWQRVAG